MRVVIVAVAVVVLATACSHIPGMGHSSASTAPSASAHPTGSPLAKASGTLDAEVPMPAGFPTDVPVYPKARLTAGASFASPGEVTWGMEWETTDAFAKVQAYYTKQFGQGDWALTLVKDPNGAPFAATFARKSNSHDSGTLALNLDSGLTVIALSFLSSG